VQASPSGNRYPQAAARDLAGDVSAQTVVDVPPGGVITGHGEVWAYGRPGQRGAEDYFDDYFDDLRCNTPAEQRSDAPSGRLQFEIVSDSPAPAPASLFC